MKKTIPWKGLLAALILLFFAAGSIVVAWVVKNSTDAPLDSPQGDAGLTVSVPSSDNSETEHLSVSVTDPEYSDVTGTETQSGIGTDTNTNVTDTGSRTETVDTATQTDTSSASTSTVPLESILGSITPPPDNSPKKIAFTFDDGPYTPVTRGIADEFAKYGGHCTYFVVGNRVHGTQLEAMKYASDLGNEIGIHAYTHTQYYNKCSEDVYQYELQATADVILNTTGKAPTLMRPVGGSITNERVAACPYSVILWNVDTKDWKHREQSQQNVNIIVQNILSTVTDGDIVLMHDIYFNTLEAVKIVLPILAEQGYEFVTVSELLGEEMQAGKKYNKAY